MMDNLSIWQILGLIVFGVCLVAGSLWVGKHVSYAIWYKDMVRQTITEMVRPEALR
jgi:hypothetical protein